MNRILFILMCVAGLGSCKNEDLIIGDRYFRNHEYELAIQAYTDYLALKPDNIKSLYNRGRAHEELGNFEKAFQDFSLVLKYDPKHAQAHLSVAGKYYREKLYIDAIYQCDLVLEHSQNANAYLLRARGKQKTGQIKDAMLDYNAAISLNNDLGEAYFYRGTLKIYLKRKSSACADFKIAESLNIKASSKARKEYCK